jgi:hypothetical protein
MLPIALINTLSLVISMSTMMGVVLHDTHVDKAALTAISGPSVYASSDTSIKLLGNDPHTHTERHSFSQSIHELRSENPRLQPRAIDDRKHILQKKLTKHSHDSERYSLQLA